MICALGTPIECDAAMSDKPASLWLVTMAKKLEGVDVSGEIDIDQYLTVIEAIPPIYDGLFAGVPIVPGQLKNDIAFGIKMMTSKKEELGEGSPKKLTLEGMVTKEKAAKGDKWKKMGGDNKTGTRGILWLNRATTFITMLMEKVAGGMEPSAAGAEAYATILKPYHGWMISKVVGSAMSSAPKKEVILDRLGHPDKPLTDEEAKAQLAAFVTPMKALVTKISDFLEKEGCNFPDKA